MTGKVTFETVCAGAGGAVFVQCSSIGSKCESILSKQLGLPTANKQLLPKISFESNRAALYGDVIATLPKSFSLDLTQGPLPTAFVPGIDPLGTSVSLQDDQGSTVRSSDFICRSRVCAFPLAGCGDQDSLVTPEFHSMDATGRFKVHQALVPCSKRSSAVTLQISLVLYDQVLLSTSSIECLPCMSGQSRMEDSRQDEWYCVACAKNQYILDPNNPSYSCQDCPIGATCDGSSLTGKVKGSVWRQDNQLGFYILEACPFGYEMIGSDGSLDPLTHLFQQCTNCSSTQYILNSTMSTYHCQQCPAGAICDGVTLKARVEGSVWVPDYTLGQYLLTSCPPGYQIDLAGRASLALQQCSLCPAGSYCIGGGASSTQCPTGSFSTAGSVASAACYQAIFVELVAVFPCTKSFFETRQAAFAVSVASMVHMSTDEIIVDQIIPTTYRRIGTTSLAVQVQSRIAVENQSAAAEVLAITSDASLNFEVLSRGLPGAKIISVAILTNEGTTVTDTKNQLILIFCLIIGCLLLTAMAVAYSFVNSRHKSDDEKELDSAVTAFRARLRINKVDGFVLHTERVSLLADTKFLVFINKSYVEAAARIALSEDFNLLHFDALCNCLECHSSNIGVGTGNGGKYGSPQYEALCAWILEVCKALIDPGLENQAKDPKRKPALERFAYFEKICGAQIWKSRHQELFERLKGAAGGFMNQIAHMCNERYGQVLQQPGGVNLAGLPSWPAVAEGQDVRAREGGLQYPEYFDSSTPAALRQNVDKMYVSVLLNSLDTRDQC